MQQLTNHKVTLRALEPEDLDFLFSAENDSTFWEVSGTQTPFAKHLLKNYLANAHQDIYEAKQLRLVIEAVESGEKIGLIDLFDFNPQYQRAGIGILILKNFQQKGFATEALQLFINYGFKTLQLHQIYANITIGNTQSISLFEKLNFKQTGIKKDWIKKENKFQDVLLYQLINTKSC
jgi:diamine N-acetyltransferase